MFASVWFLFFGHGSLIPHLTRYFDLDLALNDQQIGLLMAIPMIIVIFTQPGWGYLADRRLGRSWTFRLCLLLTGCSLAAFPFSYHLGGFPLLLLATILVTIGYVSTNGLSNAVLFSFLGPTERKHYGRIRWIGSVSFMSAVFLVCPTLAHLSEVFGFHGRILIFLASALFFFTSCALTQWDEKDFQLHIPPKRFSFRFLHNGNLLRFYFTIFCAGSSCSAVLLYLGPYVGHLGYSETFFSSLFLAGITFESILIYNLDKILKRVSIKSVVVTGCLAEGLRWLLFLYVYSEIGMLLVFMLHGPAVVGYLFASAMYIDTECEESIRSTAQTMLTFSFFGGQVFGFLVASNLVGMSGIIDRAEAIRVSFYFYSFMGLFGSLFGAFFVRKERT